MEGGGARGDGGVGFLKTDKVNDRRGGSTKTPFQSLEILDVASEFFHVFIFGFVLGGDLFLENIKVRSV